jgi:hypothetical protein
MYSSNSRVLEFDKVFSILYYIRNTIQSTAIRGGRGCVSNSGTPASYRQNTASPKYTDDFSLPVLTIPHLGFSHSYQAKTILEEYCGN